MDKFGKSTVIEKLVDARDANEIIYAVEQNKGKSTKLDLKCAYAKCTGSA